MIDEYLEYDTWKFFEEFGKSVEAIREMGKGWRNQAKHTGNGLEKQFLFLETHPARFIQQQSRGMGCGNQGDGETKSGRKTTLRENKGNRRQEGMERERSRIRGCWEA